MKAYKLRGGGIIFARNAEDLVSALNENSLFGYKEDENEFMQATAEACKFQTGATIRFGNAEEFFSDLVMHNFIKETKSNILEREVLTN